MRRSLTVLFGDDRLFGLSILDEILATHPTLADTIHDACGELRRRFGGTITLSGKVDPESGHLTAVLLVSVDLPLEDRLRLRDAFDEEWWIDRVGNGVLVIDVE